MANTTELEALFAARPEGRGVSESAWKSFKEIAQEILEGDKAKALVGEGKPFETEAALGGRIIQSLILRDQLQQTEDQARELLSMTAENVKKAYEEKGIGADELALAEEALASGKQEVAELMAAISEIHAKMASVGETGFEAASELQGALSSAQSAVRELQQAIASGDSARISAARTALSSAVSGASQSLIKEANAKVDTDIVDIKSEIEVKHYEYQISQARETEKMFEALRDYVVADQAYVRQLEEIGGQGAAERGVYVASQGEVAEVIRRKPELAKPIIKRQTELIEKVPEIKPGLDVAADIAASKDPVVVESRRATRGEYRGIRDWLKGHNEQELMGLLRTQRIMSRFDKEAAWSGKTLKELQALQDEYLRAKEAGNDSALEGIRARIKDVMHQANEELRPTFERRLEQMGVTPEWIGKIMKGETRGDTDRLEYLAVKAKNGQLTEAERVEYDARLASDAQSVANGASRAAQKIIGMVLENRLDNKISPEARQEIERTLSDPSASRFERLEALQTLLKATESGEKRYPLSKRIEDNALVRSLFLKALEQPGSIEETMKRFKDLDAATIMDQARDGKIMEQVTAEIEMQNRRSADLRKTAYELAGKDSEVGRAMKDMLVASGGVMTPKMEAYVSEYRRLATEHDHLMGFAKSVANSETEVGGIVKRYLDAGGKITPEIRGLLKEYEEACQDNGSDVSVDFKARLTLATAAKGGDSFITSSLTKTGQEASVEASGVGVKAKGMVLDYLKTVNPEGYETLRQFYQEQAGIDITKPGELARLDIHKTLELSPTAGMSPDLAAQLQGVQRAAQEAQAMMRVANRLIEASKSYNIDQKRGGLIFAEMNKFDKPEDRIKFLAEKGILDTKDPAQVAMAEKFVSLDRSTQHAILGGLSSDKPDDQKYAMAMLQVQFLPQERRDEVLADVMSLPPKDRKAELVKRYDEIAKEVYDTTTARKVAGESAKAKAEELLYGGRKREEIPAAELAQLDAKYDETYRTILAQELTQAVKKDAKVAKAVDTAATTLEKEGLSTNQAAREDKATSAELNRAWTSGSGYTWSGALALTGDYISKHYRLNVPEWSKDGWGLEWRTNKQNVEALSAGGTAAELGAEVAATRVQRETGKVQAAQTAEEIEIAKRRQAEERETVTRGMPELKPYRPSFFQDPKEYTRQTIDGWSRWGAGVVDYWTGGNEKEAQPEDPLARARSAAREVVIAAGGTCGVKVAHESVAGKMVGKPANDTVTVEDAAAAAKQGQKDAQAAAADGKPDAKQAAPACDKDKEKAVAK